MRDLFIAFCVAASLPLCFFWPWFGGVVWGWLGFLYPERLTTGRVLDVPFVGLVIGATLAGLARARHRYPWPRSREFYLLLALWAFCGLTTAVAAVYPERAWWGWLELSRIVVLILVVMALCQERHKLTALMWATALSVGSYATYGAVWVLLTHGANPLYGPRASDIENNNDFAATLVAILPFFVFLGRALPQRWLRRGALVLFAAMVIAILGTYSRAAVLALGIVLLLLGVFRQWHALAAACMAFAVFLLCTVPQTWVARVETIRTYDQEHSAAMRPKEWYVALHLGLDHPLLGAGFRPFSPEAYERYIPGYSDYHDAHNLFLQVFAEHGFPGLALYTALIVATLATLSRIARRAAAEPGGEWMQNSARMLQIGLAGYIVDGMFHCLSYRAVFFDLLAFAMMLDALARAPGTSLRPLLGVGFVWQAVGKDASHHRASRASDNWKAGERASHQQPVGRRTVVRAPVGRSAAFHPGHHCVDGSGIRSGRADHHRPPHHQE